MSVGDLSPSQIVRVLEHLQFRRPGRTASVDLEFPRFRFVLVRLRAGRTPG
jgi:hypothetical protein